MKLITLVSTALIFLFLIYNHKDSSVVRPAFAAPSSEPQCDSWPNPPEVMLGKDNDQKLCWGTAMCDGKVCSLIGGLNNEPPPPCSLDYKNYKKRCAD